MGLFSAAEGATEFGPALGLDGQPFEQAGEDWSVRAFAYLLNGTPTLAILHCQSLKGGGTGLLLAVEVAQADYLAVRAEIDATLSTMTGPDGVAIARPLPDLALAAVATPMASPVVATPDSS
jgi:hypothetical protein